MIPIWVVMIITIMFLIRDIYRTMNNRHRIGYLHALADALAEYKRLTKSEEAFGEFTDKFMKFISDRMNEE